MHHYPYRTARLWKCEANNELKSITELRKIPSQLINEKTQSYWSSKNPKQADPTRNCNKSPTLHGSLSFLQCTLSTQSWLAYLSEPNRDERNESIWLKSTVHFCKMRYHVIRWCSGRFSHPTIRNKIYAWCGERIFHSGDVAHPFNFS